MASDLEPAGVTDFLQKLLGWLFRRCPACRERIGRWLLWAGHRFYYALALAFAVVGAWSVFGHPFDTQLSRDSFDWLMRHRLAAHAADAGIVVLDIDEASLAAMNAQYGRWPWPREVLGTVAGQLEVSGARAIVFDILFSDEDIANPESEAAFDRYVRGSQKSFFPAVRLNPKDDEMSQIPLSMLPFATVDPTAGEAADGHRTVAIMTPYFKSIYDSARIGTNNIDPDADNVVRWYTGFETLGGYRIPSLPIRLGQALGWPAPLHTHNLINWPAGVSPYRIFGFARVLAAVRTHDQDFLAQFAGKIVVVGSTAPDLNDIKATPMDARYPGVFVLAAVIDNVKNGGFLRPLSPWLIWVFELLLLLESVRLFTRTTRASSVAGWFIIMPLGLIAISWASVSFTHWLIDLTAAAAGIPLYFAVAKFFDSASRSFIAGSGVFAASDAECRGRLQVACVPKGVGRERVLRLLVGHGTTIKLWEPEATGLGDHWLNQGFILWRWFNPPDDVADPDFELCWVDVPTADSVQAEPFSLARAIAAATDNKHWENK